MEYNAGVFLDKARSFKSEMTALRKIALECSLNEEMKWGKPCYSLGKANIVLIHAFKDYCAYLFLKGSLLKDTAGILVQQTENVQSARQVRFSNLQEILELTPVLKAYIHEAIEVEKAGLKVTFKTTAEMPVPDEFKSKLDANAGLKTAFLNLTPGRQKGYLLFFSSAKQSKTRLVRVDKCVPLILAGKGLDD